MYLPLRFTTSKVETGHNTFKAPYFFSLSNPSRFSDRLFFSSEHPFFSFFHMQRMKHVIYSVLAKVSFSTGVPPQLETFCRDTDLFLEAHGSVLHPDSSFFSWLYQNTYNLLVFFQDLLGCRDGHFLTGMREGLLQTHPSPQNPAQILKTICPLSSLPTIQVTRSGKLSLSTRSPNRPPR